jgi:Rod binding domain-containing protein
MSHANNKPFEGYTNEMMETMYSMHLSQQSSEAMTYKEFVHEFHEGNSGLAEISIKQLEEADKRKPNSVEIDMDR